MLFSSHSPPTMQRVSRLVEQVSKLFWWAMSVPLFVKILGIGVVVAAVFGGITLLAIRNSTSHALEHVLEQRAWTVAGSLAASLEAPLRRGKWVEVEKTLHDARKMLPEIRYLVVRDNRGNVIRQGQDGRTDQEESPRQDDPERGTRRLTIHASGEGPVFEILHPIAGGRVGSLWLGITDQTIAADLAAVTESVVWTLVFCAAIGAGLAMLLTYVVTHPIHHLVQAANQIRAGDFQTRATIFSADEIGRLAVAFNQMTEGLESYRREVLEKEQARLALIEKIVRTQENERKTISRELHDQLGQSLLALLLRVQEAGKVAGVPEGLFHDTEMRIRELIDEVGRLARGMRPPVLDDYGLDVALSRLIQEIRDHSHLAIDYQYSRLPGLQRMPNRIEVALYRIAQEAIANVVRHARASQASAVVLEHHDEVTLLVEDNGCGFEMQRVTRRGDSSLGLIGMRERAALLGGSCAVESVPNNGTTVRVRIPLGT